MKRLLWLLLLALAIATSDCGSGGAPNAPKNPPDTVSVRH